MSAGKICPTPAAALEGVLFDGMTIMSGGFGLSGNPESLIPEIRKAGVKGLTVISNNAGADGFGLWMLLESRQIRKMIASYIGDNKLFEAQYRQRSGRFFSAAPTRQAKTTGMSPGWRDCSPGSRRAYPVSPSTGSARAAPTRSEPPRARS